MKLYSYDFVRFRVLFEMSEIVTTKMEIQISHFKTSTEPCTINTLANIGSDFIDFLVC